MNFDKLWFSLKGAAGVTIMLVALFAGIIFISKYIVILVVFAALVAFFYLMA